MAKKDFMNLMREKTTELKPSLLSAEEAIKNQIQILDSLRDLIPTPTDSELEQLTQNVLKHGIKDPLTIWETTAATAGLGDGEQIVYILVDGHNRYKLSQQHQLDFRINLVRFGSLNEIRDYMIDYQLGRRNLTPEQMSYLRGLRYLQQKTMRGSNLQADGPQVNVSEALANEYGVSSRTIKRDGEFAAGLGKLDPELRKQILAGKQKLTRSVVNTIGKAETGSLIRNIDDLMKRGAKPGSTKKKNSKAKVGELEAEIRALANGFLDYQTCLRLTERIKVLMDLLPSK